MCTSYITSLYKFFIRIKWRGSFLRACKLYQINYITGWMRLVGIYELMNMLIMTSESDRINKNKQKLIKDIPFGYACSDASFTLCVGF